MLTAQGLLQVWNPRKHAATIRAHVDVLREWKSRRDQTYVWWGKILGAGVPEIASEEEARRKWPVVAEVADQAAARGKDFLLFVTDFASVHALRVSSVHFGPVPSEFDPKHAPKYLLDRAAHQVAIWFKVTDIQGLSHHQLDTLDFLENRLRRRLGEDLVGFDAYASAARSFPLEVQGPSVDELFGDRVWFSDPGVVVPRHVEEANRECEVALPGVWARLAPETQVFLASALVVKHALAYGREANAPRDLSPVLNCLARAFEWEWQQLLELLQKKDVVEKGDYGSISGCLNKTKEPLVRKKASDKGLKKMAALTNWDNDNGCKKWREVVRGFVQDRNAASHVNAEELHVGTERIQAIWNGVFPASRKDESILKPLVEAREEADRNTTPCNP